MGGAGASLSQVHSVARTMRPTSANLTVPHTAASHHQPPPPSSMLWVAPAQGVAGIDVARNQTLRSLRRLFPGDHSQGGEAFGGRHLLFMPVAHAPTHAFSLAAHTHTHCALWTPPLENPVWISTHCPLPAHPCSLASLLSVIPTCLLTSDHGSCTGPAGYMKSSHLWHRHHHPSRKSNQGPTQATLSLRCLPPTSPSFVRRSSPAAVGHP